MSFRPDNKIFAENAKTGELTDFPDVPRGWGVTLDQTGGKPPMEWMNGALNRADKNQQYQSMTGVHYPFDQVYSDEIGGYPLGAVLLSTDGQTMWQSTEDANTTDPDSASASGWVKVIDIATAADIQNGTAGKLVDAAGLVQYMSNRFAIIYPNGGSAASPANITYRQRYTSPNPFPGRYVACQLELYYNGEWSLVSFTQSPTGGASPGVGAVAGQVGDEIRIQTGGEGIFGSAQGTGNLFSTSVTSTTAPCRVKVWRID